MNCQTDKPGSLLKGNSALAASVATWGLLQLAILGIGALGFPLWAHHPLPRESLALPVLLCGQILVISMLFPVLANSGWALLINLALMLPMDELAGLLSGAPQTTIAKSVCAVGLWMAGLASWRLVIRNYRSYLLVIAAALMFTAGGAVFDYLRWEANAADGSGQFSPLSLLPNICNFEESHRLLTWLEAATPAISLSALGILSTLLDKSTKIPSTSLHKAI